PPPPMLKVPLSEQDHVIGPATAPLELVEYGDYQCPHCGRAHPIVEQLREEFGDRLRFAFRNFPLAKMHPHARNAAQAAEAVAAQDEAKFWAMHHALYTHQQNLDPEGLLELAQSIGADADQVRRDLEAETF